MAKCQRLVGVEIFDAPMIEDRLDLLEAGRQTPSETSAAGGQRFVVGERRMEGVILL